MLSQSFISFVLGVATTVIADLISAWLRTALDDKKDS